MNEIFNYTASTRKSHKFNTDDVVVVTMSSMPERYNRAVFSLSKYAYDEGYIDTMYNPLYLFRIKIIKPPIYDYTPGF